MPSSLAIQGGAKSESPHLKSMIRQARAKSASCTAPVGAGEPGRIWPSAPTISSTECMAKSEAASSVICAAVSKPVRT